MSNNPPIYVEAPSTLAVVLLSHEPLLFLSDDLHIIAASNSFSRAFDIDNLAILGKRLGELGDGEWGIATLTSLLKATASGSASIEAYEIDLERPNQETRHLIVDAKVLRNGRCCTKG